MMLEMVQMLKRHDRKNPTPKKTCALQLSFPFRIVGYEGGNERKEPASEDHERRVNHWRDGPRNRGH
jgi:hypothetical protein